MLWSRVIGQLNHFLDFWCLTCFPVSSFISSLFNTGAKRLWRRINQTQENASLLWTWSSFFQNPLKWEFLRFLLPVNKFDVLILWLTERCIYFSQHLLDTCIKESEEDVNSCNYFVSFLCYNYTATVFVFNCPLTSAPFCSFVNRLSTISGGFSIHCKSLKKQVGKETWPTSLFMH